jgi:carboxynorspermidine decarboxylase
MAVLNGFSKLDLADVPTPCFVVDLGLLRRNLEVLDGVQRRTGVKILLALKGFAMFGVFPILRETLHGVCASSPHEARLGREEFKREVHSFAAAYSESDLKELLALSDHIVFNSFGQWKRFRALTKEAAPSVSFGLRVNPEHSETDTPMYDPCGPNSRLGIRREQFEGESLEGISGLHMHTLCEKNSDAFARTLAAFEAKFSDIIPKMRWINFGGGHHITRHDYDLDLLCDTLNKFKARYGVEEIYLEPGEAVALNTGFLAASVLDVIENGMDIALLDASAAAHMPDVLEMPYRPGIVGSGKPGEKPHCYRLAGQSCLAGDVIGDYSFDAPLKVGDKLAFTDMAHYSMVKTNTFNGLQLPSIATFDSENGEFKILRRFGYEDFKTRLS